METKDKKQIILEEAEKLFASSGFSGTSVREIAKAADVNVAMISYYFGSKEQLLMAIFQFRSDYLQTKVDGQLANTSLNYWQKLDIQTDHYVEKMQAYQHLHRIIMREVDMNTCTKFSAQILERKKTHYYKFVQFLQEGQDTGAFRKGVDIIALYSLLPGITKQILFNQDFMRDLISEQSGNTPTEDDLMQLAKKYLKTFFRQTLEIN